MEENGFDILFADGGAMRGMPARKIQEFSHDLQSWFGFMQMLAGGKPARMRAKLEDGTMEHFVVARTGTFGDRDCYRNYA